MRGEKERPEDERALSLENLYELFGRNTRMVVTVAALFVLGSVAVIAWRAPSYRAKATLLLEDKSEGGGLLGELAMLGKAPQAASQIEILSARSTAEETVSDPRAGSEGDARHLGLTTRVEDPLLKPFGELLFSDEPAGRLPARLHARFECADEFDPLRELEVRFLSPERVRVVAPGWFGARAEVEATLGTGPIEIEGAQLWLRPEADLTGRRFTITRLTREEAIERVMDATRARETERSSGVIELTVDDSDPRRAADTANALCNNYLARNASRGERRATQTVDFIASQLETQMKSLREAEDEVVALQRTSPHSIDTDKSAEALITELSGLEVQRVQLGLTRLSVDQAIELLREGDVDAVSRISASLDDPITSAYLESIAKLTAEHALQGRSDTGQYKLLLQQHELELQSKLDATRLQLGELHDALSALDSDDPRAAARLGGGPPSAQDPLLEGYLQNLGELQARWTRVVNETTEVHPDRAKVQEQIAATTGRIRALLATRVEAIEAQAREQEQLLASYRTRNESYPASERGRIEQAIANLRASVATHLESRTRGLQQSQHAIQDEIERVEGTLGALPDEVRRIADPVRRRATHSEIVKFLLTKQQEAEISRATTVPSAEFVDRAVPPVERSAPSVPLHLLAGLVLGVIAALGLAFAKEALARNVFTASELEFASGLAVLASVPDFRRGRYKVRGAGKRFVALRDDPEGATAEAYRSLRANLKFALSGERQIRAIAATSCTQGEGKSSTNVALAMSFARGGRRVIVVDCDMRRPSVEKYFGLELSPGLSDLLEGRSSWRELVRRDVFERLDVLTAGAQPHSPSDALDGAEFANLIDELKREYDLVVCDVPPALAVSDIDSIATKLDGLLLVARSNKVAERMVAHTAKRLRQSGAHLIGAVLNGVGTSIANGKYGHGYGYGYGQRSGKSRVAG